MLIWLKSREKKYENLKNSDLGAILRYFKTSKASKSRINGFQISKSEKVKERLKISTHRRSIRNHLAKFQWSYCLSYLKKHTYGKNSFVTDSLRAKSDSVWAQRSPYGQPPRVNKTLQGTHTKTRSFILEWSEANGYSLVVIYFTTLKFLKSIYLVIIFFSGADNFQFVVLNSTTKLKIISYRQKSMLAWDPMEGNFGILHREG